jgi:hypothetical protein
MSIKQRLQRLEVAVGKAAAAGPAPDCCPRCHGQDLVKPGEAEWLSVAGWTPADLNQAWQELCQTGARLDWCRPCQRLVVVGTQDPDWRRQFWDGCEGPELQRNMADLRLLRAAYDVVCPAPWKSAPAPPPEGASP